MKYDFKFFKTAVCALMLFFLYGLCGLSAQEDFEYDYLVVEEEAPAVSAGITPQEELQSLRNQLSELEYYLSDLKAQEAKALAALPENIKNKKFGSVKEKAQYYKKMSDEYTDKLSNDELTKSDIKISQNLMILSELYSAQQTVNLLKKEIETKKETIKASPAK